MLKEQKLARDFGRRFHLATELARRALCEGRAEQEPGITDRMIGAVEALFDGQSDKSVTWSAKTLTDRGPNAQEKLYGADFLGVLSIDVGGYRVTKGFLAQAKMSHITSNYERVRLLKQCEKMLSVSPASFVFLYSPRSFRIVPAISVLASDGYCNQLYTRSVERFFEMHFECYVGDRKLSSPSANTLEQVADQYQTRSAFYINPLVAKIQPLIPS